MWLIINLLNYSKKKTKVSNIKLLIYSSYLSGPILLILIFATGEYNKLFLYFKEKKYNVDNKNKNNSLLSFVIINIITCVLVIVLNTSFFMSNENNNSMFTILMANSKDIFLCILSYFILDGNKLSVHIVLGLIISTIGAVMFSSKSIYDNIISNQKKIKIDKKNDSMNTSQTQIIEIRRALSFNQKMIK